MCLFLVCTLESGQGVDRTRAFAHLHYWFYVAWLEEEKKDFTYGLIVTRSVVAIVKNWRLL